MYEIGSEFFFEEINERENLIGAFLEESRKYGKTLEFLRCGRDAIGFVCDDIIARKDKGLAIVPALACDSMVKPFEVRGFETEYYKISDSLKVDEDYLIGVIRKALDCGNYEEDRISVLLMNYYGIANIDDIAAKLRESFPKITLIEDVTHIIMEPENYLCRESIDYTVGSLRKWLGIPDGAIAAGKNEFLMGALTGETDFSSMRRQAQQEKNEYMKSGDGDLKTHFRGLLADAEDTLNDGLDPYIMTDFSADYLSRIDILSICDRRSSNYHNLYKLFEKLPLCGKAFHMLPEVKDGEFTPFMLPIVLDIDFMRRSAITDEGRGITRDGFEQKLAQKGIYAPVLWPIADEAAGVCASSGDFSENMLAFPIDQRYNRFDMVQISEVLMQELSVL